MGCYYALYNPKANNGKGLESAKKLDGLKLDMEIRYTDMTSVDDLNGFISSLAGDDSVIICGGDGTLNYFINHTEDKDYAVSLYYFPCGTGNDFYHDVNKEATEHILKLNDYIRNLPVAYVKGKSYRFLNNVGFGIDGYCCQVGDEMRAQGKENINYTGIAIKGLLGGFKPVTATVTVDGKTETFKKAWLAPTMKGKFYGGGMMAAPQQDRLSADGKVSVVLFYGHGKLKTLAAFPSIFQGEHVKHTDMVRIIEGYDVSVSFSRPCALQIDGETILDVKEYSVKVRP